MTGQRPGRRGPGDPWRGGRPARPEGLERGHVEVEELPAQTLVRRRRARVGTPTAFAAIVLLVLLAAGFGVMGGRPEPSATAAPSASGVALTSPPAAASPSGPVRTPIVTPALECGGGPIGPVPDLLLVVDGDMTPVRPAIVAEELPASPGSPRGPIQIPADAVVEIWVAGKACAVAWHIALSVEGGARLEPLTIQPNPGMDPAVARQNRFRLPLTEHRLETGDLEVRAALDFPEMSVVGTWPIEFLPFQRPEGRLLLVGEDTYFPTVEGCDVVLTFRNEAEEVLRPCPRDLAGWLPPAVQLAPEAPLRLIFDGWSTISSFATCGTAPRGVFEAATGQACWRDPPEGVEFVAPKPGTWIIAVDACAADEVRVGGNRICGTWYVAIDTR